jgi:hypothetical protein
MHGYITLEYEFADNAFAELCAGNIKFWLSTGLPDYEGSLEGFKQIHPQYFQLLLDNKVIRAK